MAADPAHAEIAVMKKLTHDHVVRLHEVLRNADGAVYIVMEFVPGGPLLGAAAASDARALERGVPPLAEGDARRHFCDAACGLAYLHAVGVTHGDIKPSNLLLTSHGRLKIADFGVSSIRRVAARDDERGAGERQEGTPLFTAPELISDDAPIAPPSDVWALGVTLWVIVFGTPPFRGRTLMELYGAIEHAPLDLPADADADLAALLRALLERDVAARITAAAALTHAWSTRSSGGEAPWAPLGGGAAAVAPEAAAAAVRVTHAERLSAVRQDLRVQQATGRAQTLARLQSKRVMRLDEVVRPGIGDGAARSGAAADPLPDGDGAPSPASPSPAELEALATSLTASPPFGRRGRRNSVPG